MLKIQMNLMQNMLFLTFEMVDFSREKGFILFGIFTTPVYIKEYLILITLFKCGAVV